MVEITRRELLAGAGTCLVASTLAPAVLGNKRNVLQYVRYSRN
ncbi:MAG: hypothetical protein ACLFPL_05155 [Candidatus Nanoarchaeia archaeon]